MRQHGRFSTVTAAIGSVLLASVASLHAQDLSFTESNGQSDFHYVTIDLEARQLYSYEDDYELSDIGRVFRVCGANTSYICFLESELYVVFAIPRSLGERSSWMFSGYNYTVEDQFDVNGESFYLIASSPRTDASRSSERDNPLITSRSSSIYSEKRGLLSYMKFKMDGEHESLISAIQFVGGMDFRILEQSGQDEDLFTAGEVDSLTSEEFEIRDIFSFLSSREESRSAD